MAAFAPNLKDIDFMALGRYQVYTSFHQNGRSTGWISGVTLPSSKPLRDPEELRARSMERYGKPAAEVEQEYLAMMAEYQKSEAECGEDAVPVQVGRKKKES
jgi:hypothetical protein